MVNDTGQTPSTGRTVHYVSRGSADGIYPSRCVPFIVVEPLRDDAALVGLHGIHITDPENVLGGKCERCQYQH